MNEAVPRLVLASASPRRKMLLEAAGVDVEVRPADIDERCFEAEDADTYVRRIAMGKANAVHDPRPVLAADTVVVLDGRILGKPRDEAEAIAGLSALSGRSHRVLTAVVLRRGERVDVEVVETLVRFRRLSAETIQWYLRTGEPWDKAGGYGIQGHGAALVESLDGSYSNVVGLPLQQTLDLLARP